MMRYLSQKQMIKVNGTWMIGGQMMNDAFAKSIEKPDGLE